MKLKKPLQMASIGGYMDVRLKIVQGKLNMLWRLLKILLIVKGRRAN